MFHLGAYTVLLGTTANTDVPALTDDILQIQNTHFVPDRDLDIYWSQVMSATLSRVRLNSPRIRQICSNYIRPIVVAAVPAGTANLDWKFEAPLRIARQEELQMEATSAIAMGTERFTGLVAFGDGIVPAPRADFFRLRWTSTTAAVANAWTTLTVTFETLLPTGRYAVTFNDHSSANGIASRCIFDGQYFRPGNPSGTAVGSPDSLMLRKREMGVYGYFNTVTLPRIQVLCNGADAAHEGYLEVCRVGPN